MGIQRLLAVSCILSIAIPSVQAATTPIDQAVAQVTADSTLLSGWINDQFRHAAAFNSTAGDVVPSQLKLFGVEVGVEGVVSASKVDIDSFHSLGTTIVDTTKINMYNRMPFPSVLGHAKIGLPFGLDGGVRIGGIPSKSYDNGTTHYEIANSIFGLDVRKKVIEEGMVKPGLTFGVDYTHAKGHIAASTPYTATTAVDINGTSYTPTLNNATGSERTDWKTDSLGAQLILNKKMLIFNPYIGVSANHNSGTISLSITNVGTITVTDPLGNVSPVGNLSAGGSTTGSPNLWDVRALAGVELTVLPFIKLGIHGEVGSENRLAGAVGLRAQFR